MKEESLKPKILIVDDNLTNINILIDTLKDSGYKILIAENGDIGIKRACYAKPDLILLDIMMPGMDGFEVCKILKENSDTRDIPIIFITALSDVEEKIEGFNAGAVDYITKPFQHEEVLARINTHLTIQLQKKKLVELNKKLEMVNLTKDKFFQILAHDIRGAFSPLLNSSEILFKHVQSIDDIKLNRFSFIIYKSVNNVYNLMDNLLKWGKIQRGQFDYNPCHFDLYYVCESIIKLHNERARDKKISLSHSINKNSTVYGDKYMIEAIIRNFVSNALKFTNIGGNINISTKIEKNYYEISVNDNGIGIRDEDIEKIFGIDHHFKRIGTDGELGTGLGLILCKEFAIINGGNIHVESEEGKGTSFFLKINRE